MKLQSKSNINKKLGKKNEMKRNVRKLQSWSILDKKPQKEKPKQNGKKTLKLEHLRQKAGKAKGNRNEMKQNKTPRMEHLRQKP